MGGKRREVWDHKLLAEGLGEQHDVALHTPGQKRRKRRREGVHREGRGGEGREERRRREGVRRDSE